MPYHFQESVYTPVTLGQLTPPKFTAFQTTRRGDLATFHSRALSATPSDPLRPNSRHLRSSSRSYYLDTTQGLDVEYSRPVQSSASSTSSGASQHGPKRLLAKMMQFLRK
ncbi:hypothetical protein HDU91_002446 [Kappamyces sp. JEL0680]|nr:hypothetical protein HDU91_002446 [Kappamyces sp. JEL0680]